MKNLFNTIALLIATTSLLVAQYDENFEMTEEATIPVAILVENANFQEPVNNANITIVMREDFGHGPPHDEFVGDFTTDAKGNVVVSLLPNKDYIITTTKNNYRTQLAKIQTNDFSRTEINVAAVSLNAAQLFAINGQVVLDEGQTEVAGTVTVVNKVTNHARTQAINVDGSYSVPAVIGEDYEVVVAVEGMLNDVVSVTKESQMGNFEIAPYVLETPKPVFTLLMVDVDFAGKSAKVKDAAELDTLGMVLNNEPNLTIEIELHTDAVKSSRLNYILAQERATLLEAELLARNVNPSQITFVARGEEEIANHCKNGVKCSKEEHAENDRVVLVVQKEIASK